MTAELRLPDERCLESYLSKHFSKNKALTEGEAKIIEVVAKYFSGFILSNICGLSIFTSSQTHNPRCLETGVFNTEILKEALRSCAEQYSIQEVDVRQEKGVEINDCASDS